MLIILHFKVKMRDCMRARWVGKFIVKNKFKKFNYENKKNN